MGEKSKTQDLSQFVGRYLGDGKIVDIQSEYPHSDPKKKYFLWIRLHYPGTKTLDAFSQREAWHPAVFQECVTKGRSDASQVHEKRLIFMRNKILDVLLAYNMRIEEANPLMDRVAMSLTHTIGRAEEKRWGYSKGHLSLLDVDNELTEGAVLDIQNDGGDE